MRVAIFGTGYVGLVTGTCLAEVGHDVVCVDIDQAKVDGLNRGVIPIYEPGLEPMVKANHAASRLAFTTDAASAIAHGQVVFIAVGTPPDEDGSADLQYVLAVARTIGRHLQVPTVVVNKSTVPVGTADKVRAAIAEELAARGVEIAFDVVSNPEFLKEGDAVADCMRPDRIIIGAASDAPVAVMRRLYAPFNRNHDRVVEMDVRSAELTKYAANAMLATKISFMNEIANIAERVGADIEHVRQGIGSDPRIGWHFIYPGAGYGGSCFPKDVQALARTAAQYGHAPLLLQAVEAVNEAQKGHLFELVQRHYDRGEDEGVRGKTFAVWGLAFKPNTDDMREASSRRLLAQLWEAGAQVRAYDPEAMHEARRVFGERDDLVLCDSAFEALEGADALIVVTEWKQFRSPDFARIRQALGDAVVFDGRNLYDPREIEAAGLAYYGIGRGRSLHV
ncbi:MULTISPECIES: UDP-glucose/GDP-mannose dehydrogenase family protein [Stenotrophomonas]|uniref:UDP-glucose dehydrogenase family protein n=1 Tax=Stenotrophomonas TaxID=40323 RepID=UPI000869FF39|nr:MULTISPECIES: UDP-glucose/GDP-mannose dehydrogenase family protein [Stenotrophomonas]ODU46078.1 MAG: UDP-glucose 6-dehydrogenase [Xanthomonadaceae bacterium SCN 69-123]OJY73785.1 MAG: UDP-glucose 6-dehydrogenase [Stenotrophomonas sp. 69-14]MCA7022605.1 UDP-glucose/GDP-mannose dehydrogenase family protein [Stenotrophomonas acidaminiphila]MCE4074162.1 UDP-glucose/GDP-mannose dehydrogenase family protein [Stenotrophomonas acidaminiphila]MDF9443323.1 UDP-glucose/GDP-mannose dehydrogenase family